MGARARETAGNDTRIGSPAMTVPTLSDLTDNDYAAAAARLGVPVACIKAVAEVECASSGPFFQDGHPAILFERHLFSRLTGQRFDASHPDLSNPKRGGYGKLSAQVGKLTRASELDRVAAIRATSWGGWQILGDNHRDCGCRDVDAFVAAMKAGVAEQLELFVRFLLANQSMVKALRARDWAGFACRYNGPAYADNAYDVRLKAAYDKYA